MVIFHSYFSLPEGTSVLLGMVYACTFRRTHYALHSIDYGLYIVLVVNHIPAVMHTHMSAMNESSGKP